MKASLTNLEWYFSITKQGKSKPLDEYVFSWAVVLPANLSASVNAPFDTCVLPAWTFKGGGDAFDSLLRMLSIVNDSEFADAGFVLSAIFHALMSCG